MGPRGRVSDRTVLQQWNLLRAVPGRVRREHLRRPPLEAVRSVRSRSVQGLEPRHVVRARRSVPSRRLRSGGGLHERRARLRDAAREYLYRFVDAQSVRRLGGVHRGEVHLRIDDGLVPELPRLRCVRERRLQFATELVLRCEWHVHQWIVQLRLC